MACIGQLAMTPIHFFSQICPYFSAHQILSFHRRFGEDGAICYKHLMTLGAEKAAQWLKKHQVVWYTHLSRSLEFKKYSVKGLNQVAFGSRNYPSKLNRLSFPPAILSGFGKFEVLDRPTVSIVGARNPTGIGIAWVRKVVPELCAAGVVIVSGGARGIDYEAHQAALNCGGKTAGFLPGGLGNLYPRSHVSLFEKMRGDGLVVSERFHDDSVEKRSFDQRNRLIAGGSDLVIILEAGQKSGTMLTARRAIAEDIELVVVPGSPLLPSYEGSLSLLADGAPLIRSAQEILEILDQKNILKKNLNSPNLNL